MGVLPGQLRVPPVLPLLLLGLAGPGGPLGTSGTSLGTAGTALGTSGTSLGTSGTSLGTSGGRVLYPFGPRAGDAPTSRGDDATSAEIVLEGNFSFFGTRPRSCYVSTNGLLSFGSPLADPFPLPLPLPTQPLVAPFWADADTRLGGHAWYRQSRSPRLLRRLERDLRPFLPTGDTGTTPPRLAWALVATWDRVAFFGAASDKTNTFQAVLASDGVASFVLFNYGDLQWMAGIAHGGDPHSGLGGVPAQAGLTSGDHEHFVAVPGSGSPAVLSLAHTSNVGVPGRWVFRVDRPETPHGTPTVTPGTPTGTPETPTGTPGTPETLPGTPPGTPTGTPPATPPGTPPESERGYQCRG